MTLGIGLREDLTGRENIYIDGEIQGKSRDNVDRVIGEIIEFTELGEFIDYPIRTYSTGMKSRLAFAMIIHLEPEILIIDEALSAGDAFFADKATRKIREICNRGRIVIIVSHGMQGITEMCNRCLWLDNGRIVMDGEPERVTGAYVEAVREADEKELHSKFRRMLGAASMKSGGCISELRVTDERAAANRAIFTIGSKCQLHFSVNVADSIIEPRLLVRITRMDGFLVGETDLDTTQDGIKLEHPGRYRFEVEFAPLILGRGIFQVTLEFADRGGPIATSTTIIEMQGRGPEHGGRPLLVTPCRFQSEPTP
jgi:lipopolysaccharide transport system ATP-binding protein